MTHMPGTPTESGNIGIGRAVEVFARGFAFTRCVTHPYVAERVEGMWTVRDATRARAADYRREEYIAHGMEPADVDRIARRLTRGRYAVCAVRAAHESDAPIRARYKALGYRLGATEALMVHPLRRIPKADGPLPVQRVTTPELAARVAKAARSRQSLPEHLGPDSPLRLYAATDGERVVGWVRSIVVGGDSDGTWVSNMFVDPSYRRRGIGRSMLARMLRDDREHGATHSVLAASHAGALLYPTVGYEHVGELLLFTPGKAHIS
jgi:GNAT superfamily N-acetyltransferase